MIIIILSDSILTRLLVKSLGEQRFFLHLKDKIRALNTGKNYFVIFSIPGARLNPRLNQIFLKKNELRK